MEWTLILSGFALGFSVCSCIFSLWNFIENVLKGRKEKSEQPDEEYERADDDKE